ncbi:MAG: ATP-binding protein [Verrucomicrobiota bacterium]
MDKIQPSVMRGKSLVFWFAAGMGVFFLLGSMVLVAVFHRMTQVEEAVAFEALGRANANFLDQTPLPQSDRMAAQLGQIMGARVRFSKVVELAGDELADGKVRWRDEVLRVGFPLRGGTEVWFERMGGGSVQRPVWRRADAWVVLGLFWGFGLAFAWWIGRSVTRPLEKLAASVSRVGGDVPLDGLPVGRADEIGQLARAMVDTHESLRDERERRKFAERMALLGRMATSLAHEVRNPVSAIRLHADLLDGASADEVRVSGNLIASEAARIEGLVSQWMRYARPEAMAKSEFDVVALLREATLIIGPQATHAKVVLREVDFPAAVISLIGDRARMLQVLQNLLINAVQSMPHGGEVRMRVDAAGLEIADDGPGFSAAVLARVGEPFYSEREGGMGLGLAVSKEIIEAHGWRIELINRSGAVVKIHWAKEI